MSIATGFGFGFSPVAPGTVGAVWGLLLAWMIAQLPGLFWQTFAIVALCAIGVPICTAAARQLGGKDPKEVVWDEIATIPITFFLVPATMMSRPEILLIGFVFHRIFDIAKPPPVRNLEKLPNGTGIMMDDVAAGVYSCVALHATIWLWPWLSRPVA